MKKIRLCQDDSAVDIAQIFYFIYFKNSIISLMMFIWLKVVTFYYNQQSTTKKEEKKSCKNIKLSSLKL